MRRKISLYIADRLVDLGEQSLILFNYTMEDLNNPTIVLNSYSQQITIKGTPNNNKLFGDIFRCDRSVTYNGGTTGTDFNPSRKTSFTIYNEMNEVLESGYCKLDSVKKAKGEVEYQVSLFGGLGSFLYALSYDENGDKRSLASLDYLGTGNSDTELDFTIDAGNILRAWDIDPWSDNDISDIWQVINFAPAYNGVPEGDFAADKAIVVPSEVGLADTIGNYTLRDGYALVNFSQAYDEWAVKDLRSYLQRPVLSMRAFLEAIKKPMNNGGYNVNMPFMAKQEFSAYKALWLTLPMIASTIKEKAGDLSLSMFSTPTSTEQIGTYIINGSIQEGAKISANINLKLYYEVPDAVEDKLYLSADREVNNRTSLEKQSVIFLQMVAYATNGTIVGGSRVKVIGSAWGNTLPKDLASICGYTPKYTMGDATYEPTFTSANEFIKADTAYQFGKELNFAVEAQGVSYYALHVVSYNITRKFVIGQQDQITAIRGGDSPLPNLYKNYMVKYAATNALIAQGELANTIKYTKPDTFISGSLISKSMLLSSSNTPADYLLSFCKIFGLHLLYDGNTKTITIVDRNDLYQDETIDLSKRVDISRDINIVPFTFTSKWYDMSLEDIGGAYNDEYLSKYGIKYGIQKINTGYDFNAETTELFDSNVFKNAVTILDKSKYYNTIKVTNSFRPSVFLDQGHTFTLWDSDGKSLDTSVPVIPYTASVSYLNEYGHPGYDIEFARKMEFRDKDNKPIDGTGALVFWEGFNTYPYFRVSDDIAAMDTLNDGKPCWLLQPGMASGVQIPIFQRYTYDGDWTIGNSMDFGVPREVNIPRIDYEESKTIYSKFWRNYIRDRYDVNTKIMRCRVNFGGIQVGQNLLRKFYYFDNAIWVLNKISNYSLTTYDQVECEFVQVQDKNNYLNGQY